MPLTAQRTLPTRAAVQMLLRITAVALIAWALVQLGARLAYGWLGTGNLRDAWTVWNGIGETQGVFRGAPTLAVGAVLLIASRPLVAWIVRPPDRGCPRCGYARSPDKPCPECGQPPSPDTPAEP